MAKAPDITVVDAVRGSVTEALGKIVADPQLEAEGAAQKKASKAEAQDAHAAPPGEAPPGGLPDPSTE